MRTNWRQERVTSRSWEIVFSIDVGQLLPTRIDPIAVGRSTTLEYHCVGLGDGLEFIAASDICDLPGRGAFRADRTAEGLGFRYET